MVLDRRSISRLLKFFYLTQQFVAPLVNFGRAGGTEHLPQIENASFMLVGGLPAKIFLNLEVFYIDFERSFWRFFEDKHIATVPVWSSKLTKFLLIL